MKSKLPKDSRIPGAKPLSDEPALIIESPSELKDKGNALVIADLHFGIEYSLARAGAHLPSETEQITEHILELCSRFDVLQLILLGDIKHTVPMTSKQEWYELPRVFTKLSKVIESIEIIPGNHDGNLRKIIPSNLKTVHFHPMSGIVLHGIGFFHGHTWPAIEVLQTSQTLMAHNHPNVLFVDKLGGRVSYSCWVRGQVDFKRAAVHYPDQKKPKNRSEIIIMPAFNDIGSGTPVNIEKPEFLGPMLKNRYIDINNAKIYLLDGTDLGVLSELINISLSESMILNKTKTKKKRR